MICTSVHFFNCSILPTELIRRQYKCLNFSALSLSPTLPLSFSIPPSPSSPFFCIFQVIEKRTFSYHMNGRFSFCSTPTADSPTVPCQREILLLFHANGRFSYCSMPTGDSPTLPSQRKILYCSMPTGDSPTLP